MKENRGIIPANIPLPDDIAAMATAIEALNAAHLRFDRPTKHQLKIGPWNFYPAKGRFFKDGCRTQDARGVEALIRLIRQDIG